MKDLYKENYKTLLKEIIDDTNGKTLHAHELEESILLKWPYCPKQSIDSTLFLSNYQCYFFTELEKAILKYIGNQIKSPNS